MTRRWGVVLLALVACGGAKTNTAGPAPAATPAPSNTAPLPSSAVEAPIADGGTPHIDPAAVAKVVHEQGTPRFLICYAAAVKRKRDLAGRVETKFVIDETGHVVSAEDVTHSNVLQDDEARACIVAKFKQLEFPPPQPSGRVPITYPLLLDPSLIANQTTSAPQDEELNEYNRARPPFNPAHAAKAFASVDLSPCASAGFHGQGHVTITFDPSGVVTKAEIDSPSQMAPAAKSCVSKAFATARVAVFSGDAVTVGKTFRVP